MHARFNMHLLRTYVNATKVACNANEVTRNILEQHYADYAERSEPKCMMIDRWRRALLWADEADAFARGHWIYDIDGGFKAAAYEAARQEWFVDIASKPSLNPDYASLVAGGPLTLQWYTMYPNAEVVQTIHRMRAGTTCHRERTQRFGARATSVRTDRICPFCKRVGVPENSRHMLIDCPYAPWAAYRAEAERRYQPQNLRLPQDSAANHRRTTRLLVRADAVRYTARSCLRGRIQPLTRRTRITHRRG